MAMSHITLHSHKLIREHCGNGYRMQYFFKSAAKRRYYECT